MIYSTFLKPGFKKVLIALVYLMLVAFSASLYSCHTVYTENYTPDELKTLKTDEDTKYLEAKTKNDSIINLSNYNVTYREKYNDFSNILLLEKADTVYAKYPDKSIYKLKKSLLELSLKDIKKVKIKRTESDVVATTLLIVGAAIVVLAVIIGISFVKDGFFPKGGPWNNFKLEL